VSNKYVPTWHRFVPYRGSDHVPSDIIPPESNVDEAQAAPAHNLGALTLGELGIPGLALFAIIWLRWFQMGGSFLPNVIRIPCAESASACSSVLWYVLAVLDGMGVPSPAALLCFPHNARVLKSLYYARRQASKVVTQPAPQTVVEIPLEAFADARAGSSMQSCA